MATTSRVSGALLVLLALLLRFAIPTGYMLAGDASLAIVPCPSAGVLPGMDPEPATADQTMPMAMPGMVMPHGPHHRDHHQSDGLGTQDCPYGALAAPALPPAPLVLTHVERQSYPVEPVPMLQAPVVSALAAPPPPSRGPPTQS